MAKSETAARSVWFSVNGQFDESLTATLSKKNDQRLRREQFKESDVAYVGKLWRPVVSEERKLIPKYSSRLRELCKMSEVTSNSPVITSHRKFVGVFIVKAKSILTPMLQQLLKPYLQRQRIFNQAVVSAYAELASEEIGG